MHHNKATCTPPSGTSYSFLLLHDGGFYESEPFRASEQPPFEAIKAVVKSFKYVLFDWPYRPLLPCVYMEGKTDGFSRNVPLYFLRETFHNWAKITENTVNGVAKNRAALHSSSRSYFASFLGVIQT